MSPNQRRFKGVIQRLGDAFTVGGSSRSGIFAVLPAEQHAAFLTSSEITSAGIPIRSVYVAYDDGTATGDVATWNGGAYDVKRVIHLRLRGETVVKLLILV